MPILTAEYSEVIGRSDLAAHLATTMISSQILATMPSEYPIGTVFPLRAKHDPQQRGLPAERILDCRVTDALQEYARVQ
jgi:hypothetical protein